MKSAYIFVLAALCFVLTCQAKCDCDETDNACISQCVIEANSCVTRCKGNIECYEDCIDDKWPTQEEEESHDDDVPDYYNEVLGSTYNSATMTVTTTLTPTNSPSASISASSTVSAKMADASHTSAADGNTFIISPLTFIFTLFIAYILQ